MIPRSGSSSGDAMAVLGRSVAAWGRTVAAMLRSVAPAPDCFARSSPAAMPLSPPGPLRFRYQTTGGEGRSQTTGGGQIPNRRRGGGQTITIHSHLWVRNITTKFISTIQ